MTSFFKKIFHSQKNPPKEGCNEAVGLLPPEEITRFKSNAWKSQKSAEAYTRNVDHTFFEAVEAPLFMQYIKPTDTVLDVGAGTGRLSLKIAELGCNVTALDNSQSMLDHLEAKKGTKKITTIVATADKLPFADNQFDAIVHQSFLVHFPQWKSLLQEQIRVCTKGGMIVFGFISGDHLKHFHEDLNEGGRYLTNGDYYAACTKEELSLFCEQNQLELVAIHPHNYFFSILSHDVLTREETGLLVGLVKKLFENDRIRTTLTKFEQQIVAHLPCDETAHWIVALKKK